MNKLKEKCIISQGNNDDLFVGVRYKNENVQIVLPYGFHLDDDEKILKSDIKKFLRTIKLSKLDNDNPDKSKLKEDSDNLPILEMFWVIKNYLNNGLYYSRENISKSNTTGKILWKKTLKNTPIVTAEKKFIFTNQVVASNSNIYNEITEIQKYVISKSFEYLDWYYDNLRIEKSKYSDSSINVMKKILKSELISTNDDKSKVFLRNLHIILDGISKKSKKISKMFGTYEYNNSWEKMIYDLFSIEITDDMKPSVLHNVTIIGETKTYKPKPLRPDCIIMDKNLFVVADAKFYKYCITEKKSSLPGSDDVQKQITYAKNIIHQKQKNDETFDESKVYNCFLMPYNSKNNTLGLTDVVEYIGFSAPLWEEIIFNYQKVKFILIDTRTLIRNWSEKDNSMKKNIIKFSTI